MTEEKETLNQGLGRRKRCDFRQIACFTLHISLSRKPRHAPNTSSPSVSTWEPASHSIHTGGSDQTAPRTYSSPVASTCYKEVAVLFQGLAVFPHNVVQTQVQLVERQRLLRVGCCFPCGIVVCFLKQTTDCRILILSSHRWQNTFGGSIPKR